MPGFTLRAATSEDVPLICQFIVELAEYEKLQHQVEVTERDLRETLFGSSPRAEVIIGHFEGQPAAFALFFYTYSTFLGRPGLYLEDLFVRPSQRRRGLGRILLSYLAKLAKERGCGRFEWSVLDWNEPAITFYRSLGAQPMDEWIVYRLTGEALDDVAGEF
ncbi:MAG: GNAT family N-acetyltransferase [Proteobacteria bacterium]|nr:GNAT family N-acetyltransferase [Pseudomonadota bacterium]